MSSGVSTVYIHVIDDVVNKVREEFINSGAGESVLNELQAVIFSLDCWQICWFWDRFLLFD